ncbi:MAG: FAD-dependent oxidoreductase [Planctomycetota bacterium]|nr:FAD-dependent oxidoreductase [Planctomycetota bacterium]
MPKDQERDVVLVGAGHSHIQVLEAYAADPLVGAKLTLIVDDPIAIYSGMVPGFVAGQYTKDQLEIDARPLAKAAGAEIIIAKALKVDPESKLIHMQGQEPSPYEVASFNVGSTVAGLDLPGIREHAIPTRPISGFVQRIDDLIGEFSKDDKGGPFHVVVVGGGAGGVELTFTLLHRLFAKSGRDIDLTLVHDRSEILEGYSRNLIRRIRAWTMRMGIHVLCEHRVATYEPGLVTFEDGESLHCDALVWVTGPTSHALFVDSALPVDDRGFVMVRDTLQFKDHDDLFAVGDCATLIEHPETPKAGVYAVREGPIVARNIRSYLSGDPLERYEPQHDFLMLMNLGEYAVGGKWGFAFEGKWVMTWKDRIDRAFMRRFQVG